MCFYLLNLCVSHSVLFFFSFLCDNLLLQKCVQNLCEITVFLCVNLIDPYFRYQGTTLLWTSIQSPRPRIHISFPQMLRLYCVQIPSNQPVHQTDHNNNPHPHSEWSTTDKKEPKSSLPREKRRRQRLQWSQTLTTWPRCHCSTLLKSTCLQHPSKRPSNINQWRTWCRPTLAKRPRPSGTTLRSRSSRDASSLSSTTLRSRATSSSTSHSSAEMGNWVIGNWNLIESPTITNDIWWLA